MTTTTLPITTTTTITWTYTDSTGSSSTQTQDVVIQDTDPPLADSASLPQLTAQCELTALTPPTATDNCDGAITGVTTTTLPITTTTTITWTYTDSTGNLSTQTQDVVIQDTDPPLADSASLPQLTAQCELTALTPPTATDNCDGAITGVTTTTLPITTTTTITWTYTDSTGNSSTQTQDVVIQDTDPPLADSASLPQLTAQCELTALTPPTATDNCDGAITGVTTTTLPITTTTTITWTYTDSTGNSSTQTQDVVIQDTDPPLADSASLPQLTAQCELTALTPPTATDNCDGAITGVTTTTLPITTTTTITWTYTDSTGNSSTQTQDVVIQDTDPPLADSASLPQLTAQCELTALTPPTATDNCDGAITGVTTTTLPITTTTTITWTYTDSTGSSSTQTQDVVIQDTDPPLADSASLPQLTAQCELTALTPPTATDNCDGAITGVTTTTLPITTTTTITWTYTDSTGSSSTQTQDVVIQDTDPPLADSASLPQLTAQCELTALTPPTATDNCDGAITGVTTTTLPITTTTTITWTYTDSTGSSSTQTQDVVIQDTDPPLADSASLPQLTAQCELTALTPPTATDNCDGAITGVTTTTLPITTTTTITWTYTDSTGNLSTQTQDVVIQDTDPPLADSASLPQLTAQCELTALTPPTATDNCDGAITGVTTTTLPITTTTTITWT